MQFVEVDLDPGESAMAEAGGMMFMTPGDQDGDDLRRRQREAAGLGHHGRAARRRQAAADRREPVHDGVHQRRRRRAPRGVRGALPRQDPADGPAEAGRHARSARRTRSSARPRACRSASRSRRRSASACSAAKGSSCRSSRATAWCSATPAAPCTTYDLAAGETLRVDTGCLVALQPSVNYDVQFVGGVKTALFGGEGLFFATLTGPGKVWLQSLPLSRLADRIHKAIPGHRQGRQGRRLHPRRRRTGGDSGLGLGHRSDGD